MIKILLLSFLTVMLLDARDNPFVSTDGGFDMPFTSNENKTKEPLKRVTITIPSQARAIQKITVEFKNLDGSIESKSIDLDNAIDWHLPLFISQNYNQTSSVKKTPIKKSSNYKKIGSSKYATFYSDAKILKIKTNDKIIRNFLLTKPHRIVLDFNRDAKLKYKVITNKGNVFNKIRIGNHDKYYRVVVELDGYYRYEMKQISDGYTFVLK